MYNYSGWVLTTSPFYNWLYYCRNWLLTCCNWLLDLDNLVVEGGLMYILVHALMVLYTYVTP